MRVTVPAIIICMIGALLSIVLGVQPVLAGCTDDSQCPTNFMCANPTRIPGVGTCITLACNADHPCPSDRPICTGGFCRASASSGGGGGIPQSGVGQKCGQVKIGQVTKPVACKPGLQCVKVPASSKSGTCQKPLQ
jgi:hypothetical protein